MAAAWTPINDLTAEQLVDATDRLLSRCVEMDGHWVWRGDRAAGYVSVTVGGRSRRGHHITWLLLRGPVPTNLTYDHLCRIKSCVNPWHGEFVPQRVNNLRAPGNVTAVFSAVTHCPQGHPYAGDNLKLRKTGRACRACLRSASRRYARRAAERRAA
jgi:hypothetical protein